MVASVANSSINFTKVVGYLNQPMIKEGIKNGVGAVTFAFGWIGLYDSWRILQGRRVLKESNPESPKWMQTANKVVMVSARVSLVLSAAVSKPGVYMLSNTVGKLFSTEQLTRAFGPNTIFAINPWHPRHVASLLAVILAAPSVIQSAYRGSVWAYRKICHMPVQQLNSEKREWLTETKVRLMVLFNTVTSRPFLHLANQLGMAICRLYPFQLKAGLFG